MSVFQLQGSTTHFWPPEATGTNAVQTCVHVNINIHKIKRNEKYFLRFKKHDFEQMS